MISTDFPLTDHQANIGLPYLAQNDCAALFWEMSLFKTMTVLAHSEINNFKRVLIVCLKGNIRTWEDEMIKWIDDPSYICLPLTTAKRRAAIKEYLEDNYKYLVINYDSVRNDHVYKALKADAHLFDLIVFDESYEVYNHEAQKCVNLLKIRKKIQRCILLDGEPTAEGVDKLFGQYLMMDKGYTFGTSHWDFMSRYFTRINDMWWEPNKDTQRRIVTKVMYTASVIRKKDCKDVKSFPIMTKVLNAYMTQKQKKMYKQMAEDFAVKLSEEEDLEVSYKIAQIHKLRQILGGFLYRDDEETLRFSTGKTDVLERVLRQTDKLVVWCYYKEEMKIIEDTCKKARKRCVLYQDPYKDKAKWTFQNTDCNVIIMPADCGMGHNEFVVANSSFYYSNSEKRRSKAQSIMRLDRIGQEGDEHGNVNIIECITPDTIDEFLYNRLKKKGAKSQDILNNLSNEQLKGAIYGK